jgi:hypothetical protein
VLTLNLLYQLKDWERQLEWGEWEPIKISSKISVLPNNLLKHQFSQVRCPRANQWLGSEEIWADPPSSFYVVRSIYDEDGKIKATNLQGLGPGEDYWMIYALACFVVDLQGLACSLGLVLVYTIPPSTYCWLLDFPRIQSLVEILISMTNFLMTNLILSRKITFYDKKIHFVMDERWRS